MKRLLAFLLVILGNTPAHATGYDLDYEQSILLDAESLAEQGVVKAYQQVLPTLKTLVRSPVGIEEYLDSDTGTYRVTAAGETYQIYPPPDIGNAYDSWGAATVALFTIVNKQLRESPIKFYAINGGNELTGIFLTEQQALDARKQIVRRTDWPYIPTAAPPWFGQYH